MILPKIREGPEIRLIARCQYPKSHVFHQALLHPARGKYSHAIAVHQDLHHHARVIGWLTPIFLLIHRLDRRKVQLVHHIRHTVNQVILRQPVPKARRQQQILLRKVGFVSLGHDSQPCIHFYCFQMNSCKLKMNSRTDSYVSLNIGSCNCGTRYKLRAFAPAFRPPPAVVLPKSHVVFLALGSFFLPFFKRDFRLKKRSKCPSWRSSALCRTRCQGRGFCVHRSEVESLDSKSGRGSALLGRKGKERERFSWRVSDFEEAGWHRAAGSSVVSV